MACLYASLSCRLCSKSPSECDLGQRENYLIRMIWRQAGFPTEGISESSYAHSFADLGLTESPRHDVSHIGLYQAHTRAAHSHSALLAVRFATTTAPVFCTSCPGIGQDGCVCAAHFASIAAQPDPYGIYAVVLTLMRELDRQVHQQVPPLGVAFHVTSALIMGRHDGGWEACVMVFFACSLV